MFFQFLIGLFLVEQREQLDFVQRTVPECNVLLLKSEH